jgi:hypothetical protein
MRHVRGFAGGRVRRPLLFGTALVAIAAVAAADQGVAFQLDPQRTTVTFTIGDVLHTVRGNFA